MTHLTVCLQINNYHRWVQQAVFRAVAFQSRMIRLPVHIHNLLNRARAVRKAMYLEIGTQPTDKQVAARMNLSLKKLKMLDDASRATYSSSAPLHSVSKKGSDAGSRNNMGLSIESELVESSEGLDPSEDFVEGELFHASMAEVLAVLDDDERFVLSLRYGLNVPRRLTMQQIADMAGSSKLWVKKTEQKALRKLRRPHHQMKLRAFSTDRHVLGDAVVDQERKKSLAESSTPIFAPTTASTMGSATTSSSSRAVAGVSSAMRSVDFDVAGDLSVHEGSSGAARGGEGGGGGAVADAASDDDDEDNLVHWQAAAMRELQATIRARREEEARHVVASAQRSPSTLSSSSASSKASLASEQDAVEDEEEDASLEALAAAFLSSAR